MKHKKIIIAGDIVINLSGKSVNCRYTEKNKRQIIDSRVHSTQALGEAIAKAVVPPKLWINASSATIYHHATDRAQDEDSGIISEYKNDNMPWSFFDRLRRRWQRVKTRMRYGRSTDRYKNLDKDFSVQVCTTWKNFFRSTNTLYKKDRFAIGHYAGQGWCNGSLLQPVEIWVGWLPGKWKTNV